MPPQTPSSGALPPKAAALETLDTGIHHLTESLHLCFLKNIFGGILMASGGLLSFTAAMGMPRVTEGNPGLKMLVQGVTFPVGFVMVYLVESELFTGYPMWYTMTALQRKGHPLMYARGLVVSWIGNLIGALFVSGVLSYATGIFADEPFRSGIVEELTKEIVDAAWHVIFLKAVGCGFLVTIAMFIGTQSSDGVSKTLGLYLPFLIATATGFPHTVKHMYTATLGMMLGAPLSVWGFLWKCMLPVTLGNAVGGGLLTGLYLWWVFLWRQDDEGKGQNGGGGTFDEEYDRYHDGDE